MSLPNLGYFSPFVGCIDSTNKQLKVLTLWNWWYMEGYQRPNSLMVEPNLNIITREANDMILIIVHGWRTLFKKICSHHKMRERERARNDLKSYAGLLQSFERIEANSQFSNPWISINLWQLRRSKSCALLWFEKIASLSIDVHSIASKRLTLAKSPKIDWRALHSHKSKMYNSGRWLCNQVDCCAKYYPN